ncbi:MAG: PAS domain S-box protein, partial [Trueperaceae bacterium]
MDDLGSEADRPGLIVTDDVLRRALASLRDLLVIVDESMRIVYVSPSVGAVMGHAPERLMGRTLRDVVHPDEHPYLEQLIAERFASRAGGVIVHRSPHADGGYRYLETMVQTLEDGGRYVGAAFSARDVSQRIAEQRRLEREVAFRGALVALTNELLGSMVDARFYQHALERAVEIVPDAQAGSILLSLGEGRFCFEAAVGYDLEALRQIT